MQPQGELGVSWPYTEVFFTRCLCRARRAGQAPGVVAGSRRIQEGEAVHAAHVPDCRNSPWRTHLHTSAVNEHMKVSYIVTGLSYKGPGVPVSSAQPCFQRKGLRGQQERSRQGCLDGFVAFIKQLTSSTCRKSTSKSRPGTSAEVPVLLCPGARAKLMAAPWILSAG